MYRTTEKPAKKTRLLCQCLLPLVIWKRLAKPDDFIFKITGRAREAGDTKPHVYGRVYVRCTLCSRVWVSISPHGRLRQVSEDEASHAEI